MLKLNAELLGIKIFKGSHTGRIVEMDLRIPTTPISPHVSSPSRCRTSLFTKIRYYSPQIDTIEEELYIFNSLAKCVSNDFDIDSPKFG